MFVYHFSYLIFLYIASLDVNVFQWYDSNILKWIEIISCFFSKQNLLEPFMCLLIGISSVSKFKVLLIEFFHGISVNCLDSLKHCWVKLIFNLNICVIPDVSISVLLSEFLYYFNSFFNLLHISLVKVLGLIWSSWTKCWNWFFNSCRIFSRTLLILAVRNSLCSCWFFDKFGSNIPSNFNLCACDTFGTKSFSNCGIDKKNIQCLFFVNIKNFETSDTEIDDSISITFHDINICSFMNIIF